MSSQGMRCEQKLWQQRYNKKHDRTELVEASVPNLEVEEEAERQKREYALITTDFYNEKQKLEKTVLTVNSPFILKAFKDVIGSYPNVASCFDKPVELESPFEVLFHHWDALDNHRRETDSDDVRMHLHLLFDFMQSRLGPDRELVLEMLKQHQITFKKTWTIFVPGELLCLSQNGHLRLFRCTKTAYEEYNSIGPVWHVYGRYTDQDGKGAGDVEVETAMIRQKQSFGGDNPAAITDLPVYPFKYWQGDHDALKSRLLERGNKFLGIQGASFKHYNGICQYLKEPPKDYYGDRLGVDAGVWLPFVESGRVVLDRVTFEEEAFLEKVEIKNNKDADPTLCPPYAYGYSPSRKEWCRYYVDNITDIAWKPDPWSTLLLADKQKRVLKALVESHQFPDNPRDQAEQKGKGLVMLLHGHPGSGKTMTAETAAEAAHRILITSTLSELDMDDGPYWFELKLKKLLQFATAWGAVVLLDEADVFLETREDGPGSAEKNSLVAVFLKQLEYFSGIVFLTTNRIGSFDLAMKSRIHLALGYQPPGIDLRRQLWTKFLSAIPADEIALDPEEDIDDLTRSKLNGREISYAIHTARTLARAEGRPLRLEHLETVLEVRHEFEDSLKEAVNKVSIIGDPKESIKRKDTILADADGEFKS